MLASELGQELSLVSAWTPVLVLASVLAVVMVGTPNQPELGAIVAGKAVTLYIKKSCRGARFVRRFSSVGLRRCWCWRRRRR